MKKHQWKVIVTSNDINETTFITYYKTRKEARQAVNITKELFWVSSSKLYSDEGLFELDSNKKWAVVSIISKNMIDVRFVETRDSARRLAKAINKNYSTGSYYVKTVVEKTKDYCV